MAGVPTTIFKAAMRRTLQSTARMSLSHVRPIRAFAALQPVPRRAFSTETYTLTFIDGDGNETQVQAKENQTLLEVAHDNDIELEGACGGELACSTCHLVFEKEVYDNLPETSEEEEDMLDLAWGLTDTSRLGCQIHVTKALDGARIRVPAESDNLL